MADRLIIIGLDGVPYDLLENLCRKGVTPNICGLISNGYFSKMRSSVPEISSVAWSSMITGKDSGEHGIYGFVDLYPGTYRIRFPNFNDLKAQPFWQALDKKAVIFNVPSTYPVREMNGVHISGFVSINLEKSVYPPDLLPRLKGYEYRIDVDSEKAHRSLDLFISDLNSTLDARIKTYRYLWNGIDWKVFMMVFTGTDRLMHFLWDGYEEEDHRYHAEFIDFFRRIDTTIGEIYESMDEGDCLIMLSDHGFERLEYDVYINHILKREGLLRFKDERASLDNIDRSTVAFALDPGRIYINLKHRYPNGGVDERDREKVLEEIETLFSSLEVDNNRLIRRVYRREEVYSGPYLQYAPDLILIGNSRFNLRGSPKATKLMDKPIFTGKHTLDTAFLLVNGSKTGIPENPWVGDVYSIIQNELKD